MAHTSCIHGFSCCIVARLCIPLRHAGILKIFKGHIAHLLRHPCGAAVVDDLYTQANAQQRSAMVAELYGKEYVLFSSETKQLPELFKELTAAQQRTVLRHIGQHAVPIMEKALIDPAIVHR